MNVPYFPHLLTLDPHHLIKCSFNHPSNCDFFSPVPFPFLSSTTNAMKLISNYKKRQWKKRRWWWLLWRKRRSTTEKKNCNAMHNKVFIFILLKSLDVLFCFILFYYFILFSCIDYSHMCNGNVHMFYCKHKRRLCSFYFFLCSLHILYGVYIKTL